MRKILTENIMGDATGKLVITMPLTMGNLTAAFTSLPTPVEQNGEKVANVTAVSYDADSDWTFGTVEGLLYPATAKGLNGDRENEKLVKVNSVEVW